MTDNERHVPNGEGSSDDAGIKFRLDLLPADKDSELLMHEMQSQTDRGMALICAAALEWRVRQVLRDRFFRTTAPPYGPQKSETKVSDSIIGTDVKPGELSFFYQCDLAFCLGLVGPATLRDLKRLSQVRNKFAHHLDASTFSHPRIRPICRLLEVRNLMVEASRAVPSVTRPPIVDVILESSNVSDRDRDRYFKGFLAVFILLHTMSERQAVNWPEVKEGRFPYL